MQHRLAHLGITTPPHRLNLSLLPLHRNFRAAIMADTHRDTTHMLKSLPETSHLLRAATGFGLCITLLALSACDNSMSRIDRDVNALMQRTTADMGGDATAPTAQPARESDGAVSPAGDPNLDYTSEGLRTINPSASELRYDPIEDEADDVISRLDTYSEVADDALRLDLDDALAYAIAHSREYQFAEEEYVLAALRLLIERHRWGPRFFDDVTADFVGDANDGLYDSSARLVNEFRITQRLPYGGEVAVRAITAATEDLHQRVAGENVQNADVILEADIPLLRGAGFVAREPRIQAERDVIYAAREFERFRRQFLFDISVDFLDLGVTVRSIENNVRQVESLQQLQTRETALYKSGRNTRFEAALAENSTYEAIDRLNNARERYRLSLDRFKLRLGMPIDQPVVIIPTQIELTAPDTTVNEAVRRSLQYRLDLQTRRDRMDDSQRALANARNGLLPDLNLTGSVTFRTDEDKQRAGFDIDPEETDFRAGVTLGLPLDREIERLNVRQSQVNLERSIREYERFRDSIMIDVRSAVRVIDRSRFSLDIQERNIDIAEQRKASIEADPDAATARDFAEAVNDLLDARDARDFARRDVDVAILGYLLDSGQMRVNAAGQFEPLDGMTILRRDFADDDETEASPADINSDVPATPQPGADGPGNGN